MRYTITTLLCLFVANTWAQTTYKSSKFGQLEQELPTPNVYRTGDGSPGPEYWQQKADYKIKAKLNEENQTLEGSETVTYYNNSPRDLDYIWVQLDQNRFKKDSDTYNSENVGLGEVPGFGAMGWLASQESKGGYTVANVKDAKGQALKYTINKTMMRIDLPHVLKARGGKFTFSLDWNFHINDIKKTRVRGGYEYFPGDDNYVFSLAQWFPRMAVYDDVEGWQNKQFLGRGEFALTFGDYEVAITVPEDHIMAATGELQNADKVLTAAERQRFEKAKKSDTPVVIVTQEEATKKEKTKAKGSKTWVYKAQNVRDFAFASSRKFIWDAMGVDINGKTVMAMSYYPKEANPLWGDYSTNLVGLTLKSYSNYTFDYPYPVAISVEASNGMEYPMICFNYGRPNPDGTVNPRIKAGMFGVIIHEVGHNFFPMIVNSDERQWTWMDEGLNTFLEHLTKLEVSKHDWGKKAYPDGFPATDASPKHIIPYMKSQPDQMVPIMTNSESILQFGPNAYSKPATGLNILRSTIMGPELFDFAFQQYARKWKFKHPKPADFFRTMEDASAVDLDWFWKGWFYSTEACDISLDGVKLYLLPDEGGKTASVSEDSKFEKVNFNKQGIENFYQRIQNYGITFSDEEKKQMIDPKKYYYELAFDNVGGLLMPVIVQANFKDGSSKTMKIPAEVWRKNPKKAKKIMVTEQEVVSFVLDPQEETADIDTANNAFPRVTKENSSKFKEFKKKEDGK